MAAVTLFKSLLEAARDLMETSPVHELAKEDCTTRQIAYHAFDAIYSTLQMNARPKVGRTVWVFLDHWLRRLDLEAEPLFLSTPGCELSYEPHAWLFAATAALILVDHSDEHDDLNDDQFSQAVFAITQLTPCGRFGLVDNIKGKEISFDSIDLPFACMAKVLGDTCNGILLATEESVDQDAFAELKNACLNKDFSKFHVEDNGEKFVVTLLSSDDDQEAALPGLTEDEGESPSQ